MKHALADLPIVLRLMRGQPRSGAPAERLEAFYRPQAERYDAFRERLLHGRRELLEALAPLPGSRVVELGAGTGRNLEFFGPRLETFSAVALVDLCPALLERARERCAQWWNVHVIEGDAARWQPEMRVDCVYFSYALTMMADWRRALENALAMLVPGGTLGVVDFYVSASESAPPRVQHGVLARRFWPRWFAHDGVQLTPDLLPHLAACTETLHVREATSRVPWLCGLRAPYFIYVGRKRPGSRGDAHE